MPLGMVFAKYVCLHLKAQRLEMDDKKRQGKNVTLMMKMVSSLGRQKYISPFNISIINHGQHPNILVIHSFFLIIYF